MGERFSEGGESQWDQAPEALEADPHIELEQHIFEIERLLCTLIEAGGELTQQQKKLLRARIQKHMTAIGMTDLSQLGEAKAWLHAKLTALPATKDYPSAEEFNAALGRVIAERKGTQTASSWGAPLASEVARFGHTEWTQVNDRTGKNDVEDYLYHLGMIMRSRFHYTRIFDEGDVIQIDDQWGIANGRHRALTLRTLGEGYVERTGMNRWVTVEKEV